MKFKSEHMTQVSGSIAGVTYARAKGGTLYRRSRAIPVNPNSPFQVEVRSALTQLVNIWTNTLTPAQRAAWDLYGQNVTVINKLGSAVHISGQNWFIACNTPKVQANSKFTTAIGPELTAPAIFDRGDFTTPGTPTWSASTGFSMTYETTDPWTTAAGGSMFIFQGRPRNPSRAFFNGPYRMIYAIWDSGAGVPPSPITRTAAQVATDGFPLVAGQMIRTVVAVSSPDGRLTTRRSLGDAIVT